MKLLHGCVLLGCLIALMSRKSPTGTSCIRNLPIRNRTGARDRGRHGRASWLLGRHSIRISSCTSHSDTKSGSLTCWVEKGPCGRVSWKADAFALSSCSGPWCSLKVITMILVPWQMCDCSKWNHRSKCMRWVSDPGCNRSSIREENVPFVMILPISLWLFTTGFVLDAFWSRSLCPIQRCACLSLLLWLQPEMPRRII